jgi:hypothetical protein
MGQSRRDGLPGVRLPCSIGTAAKRLGLGWPDSLVGGACDLVGAVDRHPDGDAAWRQSLVVGAQQPGSQFKSSPVEGSSAGTSVCMSIPRWTPAAGLELPDSASYGNPDWVRIDPFRGPGSWDQVTGDEDV